MIHGITSIANTNAYGVINKTDNDTGGLTIRGLTENITGIQLYAVGTVDDTTKSTGSNATVEIRTYKKSGTNVGAHGANANIFGIFDNDLLRVSVGPDGEFYFIGSSEIIKNQVFS